MMEAFVCGIIGHAFRCRTERCKELAEFTYRDVDTIVATRATGVKRQNRNHSAGQNRDAWGVREHVVGGSRRMSRQPECDQNPRVRSESTPSNEITLGDGCPRVSLVVHEQANGITRDRCLAKWKTVGSQCLPG